MNPDGPSDLVVLPAAMLDSIVTDARGALPNEACGLIAGDAPADVGGRPTRWIPMRNRVASPYRFEIHPEDLLRGQLAIDDAGEIVWAIVHSHVGSPAVPSPSDVRAATHPRALHVIVSLGPTRDPRIRAWRIAGSAVVEVVIGSSVAAAR